MSSSSDESEEDQRNSMMSRKRKLSSSDSEDERPQPKMNAAALWMEGKHDSDENHQASASASSRNADPESPDVLSHYTVPKRRKLLLDEKTSEYSSVAKNLMKNMGYKEGAGLGKEQQGIAEPVRLVAQTTRRGLGDVAPGFEVDSDIEWNYEKDPVDIHESIDWLQYEGDDDLDEILALDENETVLGAKKLIIDDETLFCEASLLKQMLDSKTMFDQFEERLMVDARAKSNPYELIASGIFQNRAAMKMANVDSVTGFAFTDHHLLKAAASEAPGQSTAADSDQTQSNAPDDVLYFADVCAGPGGFSEYVLWRRRSTGHALRTKGFGLTLVGDCDFKLAEFASGDPAFFEPYYGPHKNGNVYNSQNLTAFRQLVYTVTKGGGLHFVMADGGFSVAGEENIQEICSKRLYMCQLLVALMCVREGGHFFCKLFDLFTPFSAALFYCAYRAFERVAIFKPITSRPANSERYLICFNLRRSLADSVAKFLYQKNLLFDQISKDEDVLELLPQKRLFSDDNFINYLTDSNNAILQLQIRNLQKIRVFAKNRELRDGRQKDLRNRSFELWNVPNEIRKKPTVINHPREVRAHCFSILRDIKAGQMLSELVQFQNERLLTPQNTVDEHSYRCTFVSFVLDSLPPDGRTRHYFVYGQGGSNVWVWNGRDNDSWRPVDKLDRVNIELPRDTMIECEFVDEVTGENKAARVDCAVHIIDAVRLAGVDVSNLDFDARQVEISYFCNLVNKSSETQHSFLRPKSWFTLRNVSSEVKKMVSMRTKREVRSTKFVSVVTSSCDYARDVIIAIDRKFAAQSEGNEHASAASSKVDRTQPRFSPTGCMFTRVLCPEWMLGWSKSRNQYYYYCPKMKQSVPRDERSRVTTIDTSHVVCLKQRSHFRFCLKDNLDGPEQLTNIIDRMLPQ